MHGFRVLLFSPLVFLLVLVGCGGGGSISTPAPTIITGTVAGVVYVTAEQTLAAVSRDGAQVLAGADVRVQGTVLHTLSDADGRFLLENVPVGQQIIVISATGYQSISVTVTVQQDATTDITSAQPLSPAPRKWTVLVYMNADNDLEMYGVQDVNEMEAAPSSDQVAVAVQMDRSPLYDTSQGDWSGAKRFQICHDDDPTVMSSLTLSPILEDMGPTDMGQPGTLHDFINWGKAHFPAEHYLLIVWNHGSGWRSRAASADVSTNGVSFDDTSGTYITTVDLPSALATSPPLDMVAFDASLMQMMEIAYEMRSSCDYIVGSEESPPGAGYEYDTWLSDLVANPSMSPRQLGITIAQRTLDYYGSASDITQSVIDVAELPQLATALDTFAGTLIANAGSQAVPCSKARDEAESFKYYEYKDLYHYAALVKQYATNSKVRAAADNVMTAVTGAVVGENHGNEHPNAHGISIYIPTQSAYIRIAGQYQPLALARATRWDEWLLAQQL